MRTDCPQCGGVVEITGPDALARCPWCGAVARIASSGGVFHHILALDSRQAERLFPRDSIFPPALMWFPYRSVGSRLEKAFAQPYPSLEDYRPPSGDLRPWPGARKAGGETVPGDSDGGRLVYHPFYSISFRNSKEGLLIDGVSGLAAGSPGPESSPGGETAGAILFHGFLAGLLPSGLIYLLLHSVSPVLAVFVSLPVGYLAGVHSRRILGKP